MTISERVSSTTEAAALIFMFSSRFIALAGLTYWRVKTRVTTMSPASRSAPLGSISVGSACSASAIGTIVTRLSLWRVMAKPLNLSTDSSNGYRSLTRMSPWSLPWSRSETDWPRMLLRLVHVVDVQILGREVQQLAHLHLVGQVQLQHVLAVGQRSQIVQTLGRRRFGRGLRSDIVRNLRPIHQASGSWARQAGTVATTGGIDRRGFHRFDAFVRMDFFGDPAWSVASGTTDAVCDDGVSAAVVAVRGLPAAGELARRIRPCLASRGDSVVLRLVRAACRNRTRRRRAGLSGYERGRWRRPTGRGHR